METQITPEAAHNEFLNIAATQGLLGLMAFLAIIVFVVRKMDLATYAKREPADYYTIIGVKGAILVFLFQALISFGVVATLIPFYIFLGIGYGLADKSSSERKFKITSSSAVILAIIIALSVCLGGYYSIRAAAADAYYKQAQTATAKGDIELSMQNYETALLHKPNEYAYHQAYADFAINASYPISALETKGNLLEIAVDHYKKAISINPHHPSTHYNLGVSLFQMYALTGKEIYYSDGAKYLEQSIQKAKNNPLYPYQVGRAYMTLNKPGATEKAHYYFNQALKIRDPYRDIDHYLKDRP